MKRWRLFGSMAVMAFVLVYGLTLALASFANGWCANTPQNRVASPDGLHEAVLFERNCGATTGFSSQVSVIGAGEELPNAAGNLFIAQPGASGRRAAWSGPAVTLRWLDASTLQIRHDPAAEIVLTAPEHGGTRVVVEAGS